MTTARKALEAARDALARHLDESGFGASDYEARCACDLCRSTRAIALIDAALAAPDEPSAVLARRSDRPGTRYPVVLALGGEEHALDLATARRLLYQLGDVLDSAPDESPADAWRRGAEAAEGDAVDYDAMNPGIRRTVRWLRAHGFRTCDSGDGATHDHECDRDYAYVAIRDDDRPNETATRLLGLLREMGITVEQIGVDGGVWVQSSFDPVTGIGIVDVSHLSDAVLPPGIGAPPPYEPPAPERGEGGG